MHLIFGGAYQGKLDYAKEHFHIKEEEIFHCGESAELDFSAGLINALENFTLGCVREGKDAGNIIRELEEKNGGFPTDTVMICQDISQGIVPVDPQLRAWREMTGRLLAYLSLHAHTVTRVFCGIPQVIKENRISDTASDTASDTTLDTAANNRKLHATGPSYIHLIRHGITEGNLKRLYYGSSDIPLADEGVDQLVALVKSGIYPSPENADYYTSGLLRAEQTFFLIYGDKKHGHIKELQEMRFGEFEMKCHEELVHDSRYIAWIEDKTSGMMPPGGESIRDFRQRIRTGFEELINLHHMKEFSVRHCGAEAHSVMVCHGGVIGALMMEFFDRGKNLYEWIPDPGHGYTLTITDGEPTDYTGF